MFMKAAVLVELNRPLVVAEIRVPDEVGYGQVLVKVHYSGICGSQVNEVRGAKGEDKFLPHLLGHEGSATVLEVGRGVRHVRKDDHVVMHWRPGAGLQSDPPSYEWDGRKVNAGWITTFNQYAVVSENRLTVIPKDFDLRLGPLFGCAITTALGVVNNDAQIKLGHSVIVFGVGGVGVNVVQGASMVSAHPIVAVDIHDSKLELARRFGATHCLNSRQGIDLEAELRRAVGPQGADVVVETTGDTRIIELAYEVAQPAGKTVLVGVPMKGQKASIYTLPLHFDKVLKGSHGGGAQPHLDIPRYVRLHQAGKLQLEGQIMKEFRLEQINEAMAATSGGAAGRCLISME